MLPDWWNIAFEGQESDNIGEKWNGGIKSDCFNT
jgi:hypothetical protein